MSARTAIVTILSLFVLGTLTEAGCASTDDEGEASHFFDCETDADCPDEHICGRTEGNTEKRCVADTAVDPAPLGTEDGGTGADSASVDSGRRIEDLVCGACRVIEINGRGDVVNEGLDSDCDGTADEGCQHTEYDEDGNQTLVRSDVLCDGPLNDDCTVYEGGFDDPAYFHYSDLACDGVPDLNCDTLVTTAEGRKLYTTDSACDGLPDDCVERDPVTQINSYDEGCDGIPDCSERVDDEGNILEHDYDCDGTMDICWTNLYDDLGRRDLYETDHDCDGTVESYIDDIYAPDGLTFRGEIHQGGDPIECYASSVRSENEYNFYYVDVDCDGVPDEDCRESGPLTSSSDQNCDGVFSACTVALDENGAILEAGDGERCLGTPSECVFVRDVVESP